MTVSDPGAESADRVDLRALGVFVLLAYGLAWVVALPLWLRGRGIEDPLLPLLAVVMMATPTIAALVVSRWVRRPASIPRALGLVGIGSVPRFLGFLALALAGPVVLVVLALVVGWLLGLYPADFVHFSGFAATMQEQLDQLGVPAPTVPIGVLVAGQFVNVAVGAVINTVPALGEELGWRGWLVPALQPLGMPATVIISGVLWGLWHAPLILLGYNYPTGPRWLAVAAMCGMTTVFGALFAWLRIRSGSVWPAALAHGSLNAAAGLQLVFIAAGEDFSPYQASVLGWSGWIVPLLVIALLAATGRFRPRT